MVFLQQVQGTWYICCRTGALHFVLPHTKPGFSMPSQVSRPWQHLMARRCYWYLAQRPRPGATTAGVSPSDTTGLWLGGSTSPAGSLLVVPACTLQDSLAALILSFPSNHQCLAWKDTTQIPAVCFSRTKQTKTTNHSPAKHLH